MHGQTIHPVSNVGAGGGNRTPDPLITNINPAPSPAPPRSDYSVSCSSDRAELRSNTAPQCKPQCKSLADELERCDREIAAIRARPDVVAGLAPAWLVTMGIEDWEAEKRLILAEAAR